MSSTSEQAVSDLRLHFSNAVYMLPFLFNPDMHEIIASKYDNPAECIGVWIKELESVKVPFFDFDWEAFSKASTTGIQVDNEEAFIIEDPYDEAINEEDIEHIEREDGEDESVGLKKGYSSVKLKSGFELSGQWRKGKREGPGLICGPALEDRGLKAIWGRYKHGILSGHGKASLMDGDCTLEGNFTNGKLHGPVRGLTSRGSRTKVLHFPFKTLKIGNCTSFGFENLKFALNQKCFKMITFPKLVALRFVLYELHFHDLRLL